MSGKSTLRLDASDPRYPARLRELADPPEAVWVRGHVAIETPAVAIVGSRRASERGRRIAEDIARDLASDRIAIVSGGAFGIDAAAHRGALGGSGGNVVVLPTPIDDPGPRANIGLFREILALGGTWLSETDATPVGPRAFCARNRIIAALADVVVVVEARTKSGTRYTVRAAQKLGRTIAAVPWSIDEPRGGGCVDILRSGGHAIASSADVLRLLDAMHARPHRRRAPRGEGLSGDAILDFIARSSRTADEIAASLSIEPVALLRRLGALELEGLIRALPGGRFERGR